MGDVKKVREARKQWRSVQDAVMEAIKAADRIPGESGHAAAAALRGASEAVYACAMWDTLSLQASDPEGEAAEATVHELAVKQCCKGGAGSKPNPALNEFRKRSSDANQA